MKPLLFLDIDGVLNGDTRRYSQTHQVRLPVADLPASPFGPGEVTGEYLDLTLAFDPRCPGWLAELGEDFEIVWASTWEHLANRYVGPLLGLSDLAYLELSAEQVLPGRVRGLEEVANWKWRSIARYAHDRPLAYVDDQARGLASNKELRREPTLVLYTPYGLGADHVATLLRFARALAQE